MSLATAILAFMPAIAARRGKIQSRNDSELGERAEFRAGVIMSLRDELRRARAERDEAQEAVIRLRTELAELRSRQAGQAGPAGPYQAQAQALQQQARMHALNMANAYPALVGELIDCSPGRSRFLGEPEGRAFPMPFQALRL